MVGKVKTITPNYKKTIFWSDIDNAYIVVVPTLPGCMSDGPDVATANRNADIAIQEWLEFAQELGNPIPPEDPVDIGQSSLPIVQTELPESL